MTNRYPKITVVTVCYNAEKTISNTIQSVLSQIYRPMEYIIVDGSSTDCTMEIVRGFSNRMAEQEIEFIVCSEQDSGIYNAMNKGIRLATGEWIAFMNADDCYVEPTVISCLFKQKLDETDILFGNEIIVDGDKTRVQRRADYAQVMLKRLGFCHQSAFVKTEYMKQRMFDESYKIAADYKFFLELYLEKKKFQYIDCNVAQYSATGTSAVYYRKAINETHRAKVETGVIKAWDPIAQVKYFYWIVKSTLDRIGR